MQKRLDGLGRILLPKPMRDQARIKENDCLDVTYDNVNKIFVIKKAEKMCSGCGKTNDLKEFNNIILCSKCIEKIKTHA